MGSFAHYAQIPIRAVLMTEVSGNRFKPSSGSLPRSWFLMTAGSFYLHFDDTSILVAL